MKKLLIISAMLASVMLTSCKEQFKLTYSGKATGFAEGNVQITFPDGHFNCSGDAEMDFYWGNEADTVSNRPVIQVSYLTESSDPNYRAIGKEVEAYADQFTATAASGEYYIYLRIHVHESLTGLDAYIEKELKSE